jgi:hypothetical protein
MGDKDAEAHFRGKFIDGPLHLVVFKKYHWLNADVDGICKEIFENFKDNNWRVLINYRYLSNQQEEPLDLNDHVWRAISIYIAKHYMNEICSVLWPIKLFKEAEQNKKKTVDPLPSEKGNDVDKALPESSILDKEVEYKGFIKKYEKLSEVLFNDILPEEGTSKAELSKIEQSIVRFKFIMQYSSKEVADVYEVTPCDVDAVYSRAMAKMMDYLKNRGLFNDLVEGLRDAED